MPFSNYRQFDSDALVVMSGAYDAVIAKLGIPSSDPRTAKIANKIVTLFSDGEREGTTLCEKACAELSK